MKKLLYITSCLVIFLGVNSLKRQNIDFTLKYNQAADQYEVLALPNVSPPLITYAPDTTFYSGSSNIVMDVMSTDDNNSENDSTLIYTLSGLDSALFVIDSLTGELTFMTPPIKANPQDNGKNNIYDLTIVVCDESIPSLCDSQAVTITIMQDTDGDGVADINDLDDDNDGILDEDECKVINILFTLNPSISDSTQLIYESTINGITETVTLTASINPTSLINPNGVIESNGAILAIDGNNAVIKLTDNDSLESALTFTSTYPIKTIQFDDLDDMDRKVGDLPSDAYGFTTSGKWQVITGDLATYNSATGQLEVNNPTNNAETNLANTGDAGFEMLAKNNQSGILIRGTVGETNNAEAHFVADAPFFKTDFLNEDLSLMGTREFVTSNFNIQFITLGVADCDIDNDGIFSQFDLDSDGDGCADALEAGHGLIMQADSTIAGPYGNNGFPDTLETDDSQTASANYTITETNSGTYDFLDSLVTLDCTEICGNGIDDDRDGKIDCEDTDCMPIQLAATDTLLSTTYCLDLPYADASLYTILLDGSIYTPVVSGCDFKTAIEVITLDNHQIILMHNASSCSDTLNLVYLGQPPLIRYAPDTTFVENDTSLVVDLLSTDDNSSEADSTLKYSFQPAGLDEGLFTIDSLTGQIRFVTPPDYENPQDGNMDNIYEVTVLACDAQSLCDSASVTITILRDNDNDGVPDEIDIDDDNDGILDTDECLPVTTTNFSTFTDLTSLTQTEGTIMQDGVAIPFTITHPSKTDIFEPGVYNSTTTITGGSGFNDPSVYTPASATDVYVHPKYSASGTYTITFSQPITNPRLNLWSFGDGGFFGGIEPTATFSVPVTLVSSRTKSDGTKSLLQISSNQIKSNDLIDNLAGNGTIEIPGMITSFSFDVDILEQWWTFNFSNFDVTDCDKDNDGILNRYDLDSDGDGCPDATESGHNQLIQTDSTIAGPYGENGLATSIENNDLETATINYPIQATTSGQYDFLDSTVKFGCAEDAVFSLKVMLHGAMIGTADGLMRDDLRSQSFIPLQQPYTDIFNNTNRFKHLGGGTETTTNAILNANAGTPDAIVDWIFIELRDSTNAKKIIKTISALVQRDGDVVDAATGAPLILTNPLSSFFVSVKHRNHLGAMKKTPVMVENDSVIVDFITMDLTDFYADSGFDTLAVTTINGKRALWAGNANKDKKQKYDGGKNDRVIINNDIMNDPTNTTLKLNFANTVGYLQGDVNLDGNVKYDGRDNDRIVIQSILLTYPLNFNGLNINNFNNFLEQLP